VDRRASLSPLIIAVGVGTLVAGIAYRFGHGLTADEPFTANTVRLPWRELWDMFRSDNMPAYYVLLKFWTAALGESELALRMFSAVAYAAAVVLTGAAAARVAGAGAGIAAAILVAASDRIGLEHAATARAYALLCGVTAAALLQSVRLLDADARQARGRRRNLVLLAATHFVGMLTHPTYVVMGVACAAAALAAERRMRSAAFVAPVIGLVAYFVLWGPVLYATITLQVTSWMQPPTLVLVQHAYMLLWGLGPGFMLAGALVALILRGGREAVAAIRDSRVVWIVAVAIIAWVLPVAVSMWKPIFEATRTPVMLLPPTCLAVAVLLSRLGGPRVATGFALICVLAAGYRISTAPRTDDYPTRESLSALLGKTQCGDVLIAPGLTPQLVQYYFRRLRAPECIQVLPFPSTLLNWERHHEPDRRRAMEKEASDLAGDRASRPAATWLLTLSRGETADANKTIETSLRAAMDCDNGGGQGGASFDDIIRCVPRGGSGR
jgi:hypothetical protein